MGGLASALQARAGLANQAAQRPMPAAQPYVGAYSANNAMAPQVRVDPSDQMAQIGQMARQMGPASAMGGMMGGAGGAGGPSAWGQMAQQAGGMMGGPGYDQMAQQAAGVMGGMQPNYDQMAQRQAAIGGGGPSWGGPDYSRLASQMNSLMPNVTNLMRR